MSSDAVRLHRLTPRFGQDPRSYAADVHQLDWRRAAGRAMHHSGRPGHGELVRDTAMKRMRNDPSPGIVTG